MQADIDPGFRPLDGIRVVEMSHFIMGPSCGMFLAQLGAEVIKVEPPDGDRTRELAGMGRAMFPLFNRGKKSVVIDRNSPEGARALDRLLATADVFVENFRDGTLAACGADPDSLRARFPGLIIASHRGFLHGPYQDRTALDEVVQMMTGLAYMTGPSGRPLRVGASVNDILGGLFGAFSVLAALVERRETGRGRNLRIGLFESCLQLVAQHMVQFEIEGRDPLPMPEREFAWPIYDIFVTRDERQIFVGAVTDGQWTLLCQVLGLDALLDDARLKSRMDRIAARHWTVPAVAAVIATRDADALRDAFEPLGIPWSPIAKPSEMLNDRHVCRPGGLSLSRLPGGATFHAPSPPVDIDGRPLRGGGDLPAIGQHTAEILRELHLAEDLSAEGLAAI